MKIRQEVLISLKNGAAVGGIIVRRGWRFYHVVAPVGKKVLVASPDNQTSQGDGKFYVPRREVLFIQEAAIKGDNT